MRLLFFVLTGSLTASVMGCGLDANGLDGSDGGDSLSDSGAQSPDGTVVSDASGAQDVTSGGPDSGAETGAPTGSPEGGSDAGTDDSGSDTGPVTVPDSGADSCAPTEICNNGIDDDCNGATDCADPACTPAWTCTPAAVPTGWSIVEYTDNSRPACATGYGPLAPLYEGPSGAPANCGCTCTVTSPGTCESGAFTVFANLLGGPCPLVASATGQGNNGTCSAAATSFTPANGAKLQVNPVPYTAGSCTPDPAVTVAPAGYAGQGRSCRETQAAGTGCANGGACAPAAQSGASICIARDGAQTCPAGFPQAHAVGTGTTDTRGCTACTCGGETATCANAALTFFTTATCEDDAGAGAAVPADGKCDNFPSTPGPGSPTFVAYEYTAQVQGASCVQSPVSATGTVTLTGPRTICCQ